MQRSSTSSRGAASSGVVIALAGLAVLVAVGGCALGVAGGGASPVATPVPSAPVVTPVPQQPGGTPSFAPQPSPDQSPLVPATPQPDGVDGVTIPLDVFLGDDVTLTISDPDGLLEAATSGDAADGMSVRWGTANVRSLGPNTVEVTWAGYPVDEAVSLVVAPQGDGVQLRFGQQAPPPNSDAMGADRVVVLTFREPVDASMVAAEFTAVDASARIGRPVQTPPLASRIGRPGQGRPLA